MAELVQSSTQNFCKAAAVQMDKPDVEYIDGLSPAISIDQKSTSNNPRSTVGTVTEIYDYLRLLYARAGTPYCPNCGDEIKPQSIDEIVNSIMKLGEGTNEKFSTNKLKSSSGIVLPDGTAIISMWLQPSSCTDDKKYCGDFYISTDGGAMYEDTRGIVRKTVFAFIINRNRIMPVGLENSDFKSNCLTGKKYSHCTGWVITHGNMDYLHCNDLDFNTKTKCKD